MHLSQTQYTQRTEDYLVRQSARSARSDLMPLAQEIPNTVPDMVIDGTIRQQSGAIAEVTRPAAKDTIQPVSHFGPRPLVAGYQHLAHLPSQPRHTLLRRAGSQVPMSILPKMLRPERVSQKVKTLLPGVPKLGLRLIQGQSQASHHLLRPIP